MAKRIDSDTEPPRRQPPATTPEGREQQMIALAMSVAEKRMRDGSASAQEVVHFLKLGSVNTKYERNILQKQSDLLDAKTEAYKSQKRVEELYANALAAMKAYSGSNDAPGFNEYED